MILLIVDSSPLIVERLAGLVAETKEITAIHKALSYEDAVNLCNEVKPDVVLVDMLLPDNKSIDLCNILKGGNSKTAFIILSGHADAVAQWKYKALGVDFILDKYHEFDQIPAALNNIASKMND